MSQHDDTNDAQRPVWGSNGADPPATPPEVPDGGPEPGPPAGWYAVHVRSRHEKRVDGRLQEKGIESFLPLRTVRRKWADRWKDVDLPLFPGYLFVRASRGLLVPVWRMQGVVRVLGTSLSEPTPVPDKEIETVRRLVASDLPLDPYPYLKVGDLVRVRRGPMRGIEGILIRRRKKHLVVVSVHLIGRSVALEIEADNVDKI